MSPKRILVISNTIDAGGAETFIMKVFRSMDRKKYIFDFLINKRDSTFYLNEIHKLGGKVFYGVSKSKNPIKCFLEIKRVVKGNNYNTILCIAVHPIGFIDLLAAKVGGAKLLLTRSTNSHTGGVLSPILAYFSRPIMKILSSVMISPSKEAGIWLFGKSAVENDKVILLNNGVDVTIFKYDELKRKKIRKELGISDDCIVVGHIGRFSQQKNHPKIVGVYNELKKMSPNSTLVLVGDGEGRTIVEDLVRSYKIEKDVLFLGIRNDISDLLLAFDAILFPSFYEGMPNTIIEAQAMDLPCIISDTISKDVAITNNITFMPLKESNKAWAKSILSHLNHKRKDISMQIADAGYSIEKTTELLTNMFNIYE